MNTKFVAIFALAAALVAGSLFVAHAQSESKPTPAITAVPADPRIDKLMDKSDQILKNQDEILKKLADIKEGVLQVRRRSS
jgi:hypothetical protein